MQRISFFLLLHICIFIYGSELILNKEAKNHFKDSKPSLDNMQAVYSVVSYFGRWYMSQRYLSQRYLVKNFFSLPYNFPIIWMRIFGGLKCFWHKHHFCSKFGQNVLVLLHVIIIVINCKLAVNICSIQRFIHSSDLHLILPKQVMDFLHANSFDLECFLMLV